MPKKIRGFIVERWMIFEDSVRDYLEKEIKIAGLRFVGRGKSDSTSSDIDVFYKESFLFSVEAKLVPAQCGQFVVIKDQESYKYSEKNIENENAFSTEIITELNKRKGIFGKVGTGAIFINLYTDAFYGWVIEHYKNIIRTRKSDLFLPPYSLQILRIALLEPFVWKISRNISKPLLV